MIIIYILYGNSYTKMVDGGGCSLESEAQASSGWLAVWLVTLVRWLESEFHFSISFSHSFSFPRQKENCIIYFWHMNEFMSVIIIHETYSFVCEITKFSYHYYAGGRNGMDVRSSLISSYLHPKLIPIFMWWWWSTIKYKLCRKGENAFNRKPIIHWDGMDKRETVWIWTLAGVGVAVCGKWKWVCLIVYAIELMSLEWQGEGCGVVHNFLNAFDKNLKTFQPTLVLWIAGETVRRIYDMHYITKHSDEFPIRLVQSMYS